MNNLEIYTALSDIVIEKQTECENRLKKLDKNLKREKKAIQIELGMYSLCLRAGFLYYTTGTKENLFNTMVSQANNIFSEFPKINDLFLKADYEEKLRLTIALRPEAFIKTQFLRLYLNEIELAKTSNSIEDQFQLKIKIEALKLIFIEWEKWRINNNIYPHMFE